MLEMDEKFGFICFKIEKAERRDDKYCWLYHQTAGSKQKGIPPPPSLAGIRQEG